VKRRHASLPKLMILISDVPLGIWLIGGMNSTTILHYASRATASQLKHFRSHFAGEVLMRRNLLTVL